MSKKEYVNSLIYDLNYYNEFLDKDNTKETLWHHGEQLPFFKVKRVAQELADELTKISEDKTYKPWR